MEPVRLVDAADDRRVIELAVLPTLDEGCEITSITTESAGSLGALSTLSRVRVSVRNRDDILLVLKKEPQDASATAVVDMLDSLGREFGFFSALPEVAAAVSVRCWAADFEPTSGRLRIVLEDAGPQSLPSQAQGCPLEVAEQVVRRLATLHAMTDGARPDDQTLAWCPVGTDATFDRIVASYRRSWPAFQARYENVLPSGALQTAEHFAHQMPALVKKWSRYRSSVIHGDARLDNVVQRPDGEVRLIDWQMVALGEGAFDLSHFLAGSLSIEDRRRHQQDLLDIYRFELRDFGVAVPGRTELDDAVRRTALLVLPLNVIFNVEPATSPETASSRQTVLDRYFTAIADYGSSDFLL